MKSESKFRPIVPAEELKDLKKKVLSGGSVEQIPEQPHGIDFAAQYIVYLDGRPRRVPVHEERDKEGNPYSVAHLEGGREYFIALEPALQERQSELDYKITVLPKSSLLRAGIEGWPESFVGPISETKIERRLGEEVPDLTGMYDGRYATFRIRILNPNGVEIEEHAPVVQVLFEKKEAKEAVGPGPEKKDERLKPLHLGEVLKFNNRKPRISAVKERQELNVSEPLGLEDGAYVLKRGVPYLLRTAEAVALSEDEIGNTQGLLSETEFANGSALVDAGYKGKLTYLVFPSEDIVLGPGDKIADLLVTKVPATQKTYQGQWS